MVVFVSTNCSSRSRPHDPIDGTVIVPVVSVRIVPVIGVRIEERETKRIDKDECSIVERRKRLSRPLKNRCVPVMVLGAKRGAGRVIAGRVIIGKACVAADAKDAVKPSAATPIKKNMRFVFIDN